MEFKGSGCAGHRTTDICAVAGTDRCCPTKRYCAVRPANIAASRLLCLMQARRIRESTRTARLASTHYPKLELPDVATEAYICGERTLKILLLGGRGCASTAARGSYLMWGDTVSCLGGGLNCFRTCFEQLRTRSQVAKTRRGRSLQIVPSCALMEQSRVL